MGHLVDGVWDPADRPVQGGKFVRAKTQFRNWITPDGTPGPTGQGGFTASPGRYHLYVSHACPWAHRAMIVRRLKHLEDIIGVSVVHWLYDENGWSFNAAPGVVPDPHLGATYLYEIYATADPTYSGRASVPILWDIEQRTIVSNESSEIIRMLNSAFDDWSDAGLDLYPAALRGTIDTVNDDVYPNVNNGVYRTGFAKTQDAYDQAVADLFACLDRLEDRLGKSRYIAGSSFTEADIRLFTTLVRFDPVYHGHFKCNLSRLVDYPNLWNYTLDIYQRPGIVETVHLDHIKHHYYASHESINPLHIVPIGPDIDYTAPHDRNRPF